MLLIQNTSHIWFLQRFFIVKNVFNSILIIIFFDLFPRITINGIPPHYHVLTGLGMFSSIYYASGWTQLSESLLHVNYQNDQGVT